MSGKNTWWADISQKNAAAAASAVILMPDKTDFNVESIVKNKLI